MEMDVLISLLKELKNLRPWKRMENCLIFVRHEKVENDLELLVSKNILSKHLGNKPALY